MEAVSRKPSQQTPKSSYSGGESQLWLHNYFSCVEPWGTLPGPAQFFLNHRCFMRSEVPEQVGIRSLMTGQPHPHWRYWKASLQKESNPELL